jgi:PleD family two-component response regulator
MHIEHPRSEAGRFVTISLGVAGRSPGNARVETLMSEAEQALYLAKVEGGDRVIVAEMPVS